MIGKPPPLVSTDPGSRLTCLDCGSTQVSRGLDTGYVSASELGRPKGAKGTDSFVRVNNCAACGSFNIGEVAKPCHICGSAGTIGYHGCDISKAMIGDFAPVPGLPNIITLCGDPGCLKGLEKEVGRRIKEADEADIWE